MRSEMQDAARNHQRIAQNIRDLVVHPFSRWCDAHEARIQESQDELQSCTKAHDRQANLVRKLRSNYFNKCRLVEDLEEENKLAFRDPESSPSQKPPIPEIKVQPHRGDDDADDEELYEIGDEIYQPQQVKQVLSQMLSTIKMGETKVPILGTYLNTSAGSDIVEYLQHHMGASSISQAEGIGQDLISNGFLRLVGNVGSTFANSSRMFYQWRPKAFKLAGVPEKKQPLSRSFTLSGAVPDSVDSPVVGTVSEYLANWNVLNSAHPNETPAQRLQRESKEADDKYKAAVSKLDRLRCELEEAVFLHLKFLERCELDRLKAIKTVILDFSGAIGNVIPSLQSTVDKMVLFQETIQPLGDLRYLLENYRTGSFVPRVVVYENYYNKVDEQTFGVDLEARARADKKRVPALVTTLLTFLDHRYPDLEGDEARRGVWLLDVPLAETHKLRARINNGKAISQEVLADYDIPTVASLFKLYLLELPGKSDFTADAVVDFLVLPFIRHTDALCLDSLVSSHVYEIIRTIYTSPAAGAANASRISMLQQTLSQLRLTNIATLDACMNHFTRLIDLTSADEDYVNALAASLGPCILRPRVETSLTMEERHSARLVRDLLANKEAIFNELKRLSTLNHAASAGSNRPRAVSTDESNRKALVEERNRALLEKASASRGRASSPVPGPRGHRRDRSSGGPETRFPIQTSPTSSSECQRSSVGSLDGRVKPSSALEVPGSEGVGLAIDTTNGSLQASKTADAEVAGEKRDSGGRPGAKFVGGKRVAAVSSLSTPPPEAGPRGVRLEDKPMDD